MSALIAIDPGKATGWASFVSMRLIACGLTNGDDPEVPLGVECYCEIPDRADVPLRDVIRLAARAGMAAGRTLAPVTWVAPVTWKGSLPKAVSNARTLARLDAEERAIVEAVRCPAAAKHNVLDAIGIGLYAIGRGR